MQHAKKQPETPTENYMSQSESILKDMKEVVPVHHSDRPAGKAYKFAEFSSGLDSPDISVHKKAVEAETAINHQNPRALAVDIDHWNALRGTRLLQKNRKYASVSKSKKLFQSSLMTPSKGLVWKLMEAIKIGFIETVMSLPSLTNLLNIPHSSL
ncbi:hypothetical protein K1719_043703 [Acacia pycnantha]|nr:hypothetical protein K1719_043703 [Acacia pycnantha]